MGARSYSLVWLIAAGAFVTACSSHGPTSGPAIPSQLDGSRGSPAITETSPRELAAEAAARAAVAGKLRAGFVFQAGGTVHGIDVAIGQPPVFRLGHGDVVDIKLVPNTEPRYLIHGPRNSGRSALALPVACDGCDNAEDRRSP